MEPSIWDQILFRIETKVNQHSFQTWFKPTSFVADNGKSITVHVPNTGFKDWLTKHYSVVLSEALAEVRRPGVALVFLPEGARLEASLEEPPPPSHNRESPPTIVATPPIGLNERYSFDTFIVGPSNQFAHAACRAVAEAPSRWYRPSLHLWGSWSRKDSPDARNGAIRAPA